MRKTPILIVFIVAVLSILTGCNANAPNNLDDVTDDKIVCIFFDDGWQNQYDVALPILLQYGFQATFSIITDSID